MIIRSYICLETFERLFISLLAWRLALMAISSQAQTTLNVTNYGAKGDCAQIWVNTTSNSETITCTNDTWSTGDVGKTVEIFGVGNINIGNNVNNVLATNCQDFIGIITNYVNSTNVQVMSTLGELPQATSNGVYCIYGTQNVPAFTAAIAAANGTNTIIKIPAGNYLLIPPEQYTNFTYTYNPYAKQDAGIILNKGGIHFVGAGVTNTILTADGAFKNQGYTCMRGGIFIVNGPITNDYPLIWDSLTFDGGLQYGLTGHQGVQPADWVDGLGWDGFSFAGLDAGSEPLNIFKEFTNCRFQHFRGEMIKGTTGSAGNETILVTNCVFTDGNATAFNYNFAHTITDCTFSNMYQIEEFYLEYPTNAPSYFVNNYATNIQHSFIALNGGTYTNEPYVISNNVFYQSGGNGIATCPATSVLITSNQFIGNPLASNIAIVLGEAGYQGYSDNSNIVITANNFSYENIIVEIAGGTSSTDPQRVEDVQVYNNTAALTNMSTLALEGYNWSTNIHFFNNDFLTSSTNSTVGFSSGSYNSPYALVDTNNLYYKHIYDNVGVTNTISYANGSRFEVINAFHPGTVYSLTDTNASQIPPGAQILIYNDNASLVSIPVFLNSALTLGPVMVPNGQTLTVNWNGSQWTTNSVADELPVPLGLAIRLQ